jgi:hypothetical protein
MAADRPLKVLFIAGHGRSGSTILGNVLGEIEDCFHAGELRNLWDHGLIDDVMCGCGEPFSRCGVWRTVVARTLEQEPRIDPRAVLEQRERSNELRTRLSLMSAAGRRRSSGRFTLLTEGLRRLYPSIAEATGCRIVVDSTKLPSYGFAISTLPNIELYGLHLIRDPRAVAYSWTRAKERKDLGPGRMMRRFPPGTTAAQWVTQNLASSALVRALGDRGMTMRYEDFVADPPAAIRKVLSLLGEEPASLPFVSSRSVNLGTNHTIFGNPSKFARGVVDIRPDDEWRTRLGLRDRSLVSSITMPVGWLYGYGAARPAPSLALQMTHDTSLVTPTK